MPLVVLFSLTATAQKEYSATYEKSKDEKKLVVISKTDNGYEVKINGTKLSTFSAKEKNLPQEIKKVVLDKLSDMYGETDASMIKFAENFSLGAMARFLKSPEAGDFQKVEISDGLFVKSFWTKKGNLLFYLDNETISKFQTVNLLKWQAGGYNFLADEISKAPEKSIIIKNLPIIYDFMLDHPDAEIPEVRIKYDTSNPQIIFVNHSGLDSISISKKEAEALKGFKLRDNTYALNLSGKAINAGEEVEQESEEGEKGEKPQPNEKKKAQNSIGPTDIDALGKNYQLELRKSNEIYFLTVCGPQIRDSSGHRIVAIKRVCIESVDGLSSLENNDSLFYQAVFNVLVKLNDRVGKADRSLRAEIGRAYTFFYKSINEKPKSGIDKKIEEELKRNYSSTFKFADSSIKIEVTDAIGGRMLELCKINSNDPDTCVREPIDTEIKQEEFSSRFVRMIGKIKIDIANDSERTAEARTIGNLKFDEWKAFEKYRNSTVSALKSAEEDKAKQDAYAQSLLHKIDSLKALNRDTGFVYVSSTLKDIDLHKRRFKDGVARASDPINAYRRHVEYDPSGLKVSVDSLSLRIEDGFIVSILIVLNRNDVNKYGFNRSTTIRQHYDLRSSTDAGEVANIMIPVESRKLYVGTRNGFLTPKGKKGLPRGFTDSRSKEKAKNLYYSQYFVRLGDMLHYFPNIDSLGDVLLNLRSRNISFVASHPEKKIKLTDKDFNSFSQLNIFTDLVGFSEDKPNGLIQVEGKFETGIFSQPINNRKYYSRVKFKILPSAYASFTISKVENKLKYFMVPKDSVRLFNEITGQHDDTLAYRRRINNLNLIQFSNLIATAHFNVFSVESDYVQIKLYLQGGIVRTPISDTTVTKDILGNSVLKEDRTIINSLRTTMGIAIKLKSTSRLGVDFGFETQSIIMNEGDITQAFTAYDKNLRRQEFKETKYHSFPSFNPQIYVTNMNIYYYLDKDQQNRIYIRGKYFKEFSSRSDDLLFLQLGYSTELKGFFGLFKKD